MLMEQWRRHKPQEHKISRSCNLCNFESSKVIFTKNGFNLVQCLSCGLVYVGNPPSKVELEKLYSFDSGYKVRLRDNSAKFEYDFKLAKKRYELIKKFKKRGRILDIGCSTGFFLDVAKKNGWETFGIEISKDLAELAKKRYGLNVFIGTLDEINFASNFFDAVTMWDVIEHVENPMRTLCVVNRILKNDGIVIISTPNIDGLFPKLSYKVSNVINFWPHPEPPYHLFQFSKETVKKLLNQAGFKVLEIYDKRIGIIYSVGKSLTGSPRRLLQLAPFIPFFILFSQLGPVIHRGDWITVISKKAGTCKMFQKWKK